MPTATKLKAGVKAKAGTKSFAQQGAKRPAAAEVQIYAWQFSNQEAITAALTPFQLNGLKKAIDVLNTAGIKLQVTYPKMGRMKPSES